jgi:hypothetical protein
LHVLIESFQLGVQRGEDLPPSLQVDAWCRALGHAAWASPPCVEDTLAMPCCGTGEPSLQDTMCMHGSTLVCCHLKLLQCGMQVCGAVMVVECGQGGVINQQHHFEIYARCVYVTSQQSTRTPHSAWCRLRHLQCGLQVAGVVLGAGAGFFLGGGAQNYYYFCTGSGPCLIAQQMRTHPRSVLGVCDFLAFHLHI